jgi:hypothetical protein
VIGKTYGRTRRSAPAVDATPEEAYRLVDIEPVRAPEGCTGRDWLIYRIAQGDNLITGYREGALGAATAEVEKIVVALNERRIGSKGRPGPKPKSSAGAAAPAAPAAAPDPDEGAS